MYFLKLKVLEIIVLCIFSFMQNGGFTNLKIQVKYTTYFKRCQNLI